MASNAFGVDFFRGCKNDLLVKILEESSNSFRYIVTPNVNHLAMLERSKELALAYSDAYERVCDSRILEPLIRIFGGFNVEVIPGSDLTHEVLGLANTKKLAVAILGSDEWEVDRVRKRFPYIVFYHYNPPFGFIDDPDEVQACIDFILNYPANFVFFAVGCPRQEILAHSVYRTGRAVGVGFCVGASISFLSGKVKRAPLAWRNLRLEWLYRFFQEPRRLGIRYAGDLVQFLPVFFRELKKRIL